jgi:excisionase family DNA binding protein
MPSTLLRPEDVAKRLNVSTETVLRYLRDKSLNGVHLKRAWRVREEDLEVFLKSRETVPTI